eukprot:COSAG03_NODE_1637_length_3734_cov_504.619807_4_plen_72_part_00
MCDGAVAREYLCVCVRVCVCVCVRACVCVCSLWCAGVVRPETTSKAVQWQCSRHNGEGCLCSVLSAPQFIL